MQGGKWIRTGAAATSLAACLCLSPTVAASAGAPAAAAPVPPAIASTAVVLMDQRSGQVLFSHDADTRVGPASLAKMMTFDLALAAIASGQAQAAAPVPVGVDAWRISLNPADSRMFLLPNVPVPLKDLLIGMMVPSGNDAALAVADFLGGTEAGFVSKMNVEAARLGMTSTHFVNSHGLGAPTQLTTATDMAVLARHIWSTYPDFRQYTSLPSFTWDKITQRNWNRLVGTDPRVFGLKSGHLSATGYHLVATATGGDLQLIAVVLGAPTLEASANDDEELLNWGFANFHDVQVNWQASVAHPAPVWKGHSSTVPLRVTAQPWITLPGAGGPGESIAVEAHLLRPLVAPIAAGQRLGSVEVWAHGTVVERVPITAAAAVARGGLLHVAWDALRLRLGAFFAHVRL